VDSKFKEIIHLLMAFLALSVLSSGLSALFWDLPIFFLGALSILKMAFLKFFCVQEHLILKVNKRLRDFQKIPFKENTPLYLRFA